MAESKRDKLNKEYEKLCELDNNIKIEGADDSSEDSGNSGEENLRTLRSGIQHPRVSPTNTNPSVSQLPSSFQLIMSNPTTSGTGGSSPPPAPQTHTNAPIKLLQTSVSVRAFTGTEGDYSARDFIEHCENVMRNSCIVEDADKSAFVRSRLEPGSPAGRGMVASAFAKPIRKNDYGSFRTNFLIIFAGEAYRSLVKGVSNAVRSLIADVASLNLLESQVLAYRITEDFDKYLRDNGWNDGGYISMGKT